MLLPWLMSHVDHFDATSFQNWCTTKTFGPIWPFPFLELKREEMVFHVECVSTNFVMISGHTFFSRIFIPCMLRKRQFVICIIKYSNIMLLIMIPLSLKPTLNRQIEKSTTTSSQRIGISGPKITNRFFWKIWYSLT